MCARCVTGRSNKGADGSAGAFARFERDAGIGGRRFIWINHVCFTRVRARAPALPSSTVRFIERSQPLSMSEVTFELDESPSPENFRVVLDGVRAFNRDQTGNERPRPVAYFLREAGGEIVGGVHGSLWGRSMHIDALWVDEKHRGHGNGSKLMRKIEVYAAAHGHPLVYLETASFQALPFYQALGYAIFGQLEEITAGETLYFLMKHV